LCGICFARRVTDLRDLPLGLTVARKDFFSQFDNLQIYDAYLIENVSDLLGKPGIAFEHPDYEIFQPFIFSFNSNDPAQQFLDCWFFGVLSHLAHFTLFRTASPLKTALTGA
jgi:hypothetical protein